MILKKGQDAMHHRKLISASQLPLSLLLLLSPLTL
jgi:hypothetical protein